MKKPLITLGQLQMIFGPQTVEIGTAILCPVCHQVITETAPCEHTLGTTEHMFDPVLLFHSRRARCRKAPKAA